MSRKILLLIVAVTATAALAVPAPAPAQEKTKASIRFAWKDLRSALRHEEGAKACRRMTLKFRRFLLGEVKKAGGGGLGCEKVIDMAGKEAYDAIRNLGERLGTIKVDGSKARACTPDGGILSFRKEDGIWKFNGDGTKGC